MLYIIDWIIFIKMEYEEKEMIQSSLNSSINEKDESPDPLITGDLKERFFSDDEADDQVMSQIKQNKTEVNKCLSDAKFCLRFIKIKSNEEPDEFVIDKIIEILEVWNNKKQLSIDHDIFKQEIVKLIWQFVDMVIDDLGEIKHAVLLRMQKLFKIMQIKNGVFNFDKNKINDYNQKIEEAIEKEIQKFCEKATKNIKIKKRRKTIKKRKKGKLMYNY